MTTMVEEAMETDLPEGVWERLGLVIGQRRESLGISKSEAARRAQISATTWRLLERGAHDNPTDVTLVRIARVLRLDPGELLEAVGREYKAPPVVDIRVTDELGVGVKETVQVTVTEEMSHDEAFITAIEGNPRLDVQARQLLMQMYRVLVERGR